jgi:undecaprenyl diphosphate synthase
MDGNGRWATSRGLSRLIGHKRGASRVKNIVQASPDLGVTTLTFYAFSTENWKRAAHEVEGLMKLFRGYMQNNLLELHQKNVRVRFLGDPTPLAQDIRSQMDHLTDITKDNTGLNLNIAINYGGRDELVRAVRKISDKVLNGQLAVDEMTEGTISEHLDTQSAPIRRISSKMFNMFSIRYIFIIFIGGYVHF